LHPCIEIPGFVPDSTAPASGAFLFLGVCVPSRTVERHANQISRGATLCQKFAAFKSLRAAYAESRRTAARHAIENNRNDMAVSKNANRHSGKITPF
jgi:hypothetical protein